MDMKRRRVAEPAAIGGSVVEETEARCPVYNLMVDASVNIEMLWVAKAREA